MLGITLWNYIRKLKANKPPLLIMFYLKLKSPGTK